MKKFKCIICEQKGDINLAINWHEVFFCSENCLEAYKIKLEEIKKIVDWDNCC